MSVYKAFPALTFDEQFLEFYFSGACIIFKFYIIMLLGQSDNFRNAKAHPSSARKPLNFHPAQANLVIWLL